MRIDRETGQWVQDYNDGHLLPNTPDRAPYKVVVTDRRTGQRFETGHRSPDAAAEAAAALRAQRADVEVVGP